MRRRESSQRLPLRLPDSCGSLTVRVGSVEYRSLMTDAARVHLSLDFHLAT